MDRRRKTKELENIFSHKSPSSVQDSSQIKAGSIPNIQTFFLLYDWSNFSKRWIFIWTFGLQKQWFIFTFWAEGGSLEAEFFNKYPPDHKENSNTQL